MNYINPNEYGGLLFDDKEKDAIIKVLENDKIFRYGEAKKSKVDEFEEILKQEVNSKYSLGVINGTAGLITALVACNLKPKERVLISSYTFLATALAVKVLDGIPIPINIDLETGLDLEDLEMQLKKGCKAVIVVQFQGRCFNLDKVKEFTNKYNVFLIEDSCQAFGANNGKEYAGTIGDIGVYSFQQYKQLTCGEGGAVVTNNPQLYLKMRNYSDMGSERDLFPNWNNINVLFGQNYRMNNISAAILCEQLKKLDSIKKSQHQYRNYILEKTNCKKIINSVFPKGDTGMNILLLLDSKKEFDEVKERAIKNNIEIRKMWNGLYFENNLFINNKLTDIDLKEINCNKSKELVDKLAVISIPPILNYDNCDKIIELLNQIN